MTSSNNVAPLQPATDFHKSAELRDDRGRWLRGPGRKYGSKNRHSAELMKLIRADGHYAIEQARAALYRGERWAIELYLKYNLPSRTVEMEGAEPEDLRQAFISGEIDAETMKAIATGLEKLANIESFEQLVSRMIELEAFVRQQSR